MMFDKSFAVPIVALDPIGRWCLVIGPKLDQERTVGSAARRSTLATTAGSCSAVSLAGMPTSTASDPEPPRSAAPVGHASFAEAPSTPFGLIRSVVVDVGTDGYVDKLSQPCRA